MFSFPVGLPLGVVDQLLATGSEQFRVDGSGSSRLVVTAIGLGQLLTIRDEFVDFLKTVSFVTNDQAASSEHSISLVVQEHPLETTPPSLPGVIRVDIIPVNDRPVITSTQRSRAGLTDYIPESNNRGFTPSFLLNETNIVDIDQVSPIFIGLAITTVTTGDRGHWMVWINDTWVSVPPSVSECSPQLEPPNALVRFLPSPDYSKTDTRASLVYRAWDGTNLIPCVDNTPIFSEQSALSAENETFTFDIQYLNRAPSVLREHYALPSIEEDTASSEGVAVSAITDTVASDEDDTSLGLALVGADSENGMWQYRNMGNWTEFPTWLSPEQALLLSSDSQVRFIPNSDYFGPASFRAVMWDMSSSMTNTTASDAYTGAFSTEYITIRVSVNSVNDLPVVTVGIPVVTYTEGGPAIQIFRNLSIMDVDSTDLVWALVILECPLCWSDRGSGDIGSGDTLLTNTTDVLLTRHAPSNFLPAIEHSDSMQIVLRVSAVEDTDNSPAEFVRYLESLYFTSASREPANTPRLVRLVVSDSSNESESISVTIEIDLINDEPPSLTLPYTRVMWVEDTAPLQLFSLPVYISDPDQQFPLAWASLQLRNYDTVFESLNCSQFVLDCIFQDGVLTLSGQQSLSVYQQALTEVYYINNNPEPAAYTRQVDITVFDGQFYSPVTTLLIDVELVNDQLPEIVLGQSEVIFREPASNPITTRVRVAPNVTITDTDSGMFPLHSATVTILDPLNGDAEGLTLPSGVAPLINVTGQYQHSLMLFYEGGIPLITLQDALQTVEYFNSAEQMYDNGNRTIEIAVNDSLTLGGIQSSNPVEVKVVYVGVDDPPEVRLSDNVLLYNETQTPQPLRVALNADIIDVDGGLVSRLEIQLRADSEVDISQESLQLSLTGVESTVTQLPSENPTYIVLSGEVAGNVYSSVLRTLMYQHLDTTGNPETGLRTITVTPFSQSGRGTPDSVVVAFTAVNNAPVVDLNGLEPGLNGMEFFPEESPQPIPLTNAGVNISDVDNEELMYVRVELLNPVDGDMEYIAVESMSLEVVSQTGTSIELRGQPSPIAAFEESLRTLTYHNLADEPQTITRRVSVEVNDGETSGLAYIEVIITPLNDAPELVLSVTEVVYTEESTVRIATESRVFDPDSSIVGYRVRPDGDFPDDVISGPYLSYVQDSGVYVAELNLTSPELVPTLLTAVTFSVNNTEPTTANRVLCISVEDEYGARSPEACVSVSVHVINDNQPEFLQSTYNAEVLENQPNTFVTQITAFDPDSVNSNVTLEYSITGGDDCSQEPGSGSTDSSLLVPEEDQQQLCVFEINPLTGEVTTTLTPPDRETNNHYMLTITVSDGVFTSDVILVVSIADENDVAPVFVPELYEVLLPVGAVEGDIVAQLMVDDPDLDTDFSVILLSMVPHIGREVFALDPDISGRIILNRPERDIGPSVTRYILTYEAVDAAFHISTNVATIVVNVTQNQQPPLFDASSYTGTVSEIVSEGFPVLTVTASDSDPGYHGEFNFSIPNSGRPFTVDPRSGVVSVSDATSIDFERVQEYVFTVVAMDTGRPPMSSSVEVTVGVVNVNDNPPMFDEDRYLVEVCEGAPIGYVLLQVSVNDADGDTLNFNLVDMFGCSECVGINTSTGALSVARELDYEQMQMVSVSIIVDDRLFFQDAVVNIDVLNDNEAAPDFKFESLIIEIPETEEPGSILPLPVPYIPLASDADSCSVDQCNGSAIISRQSCSTGSGLMYSITSGNEEGLFEINPSVGLISVSQSLDVDVGIDREFNLSLGVSDGQFEDSAYLTIIVTDINDNLPEFSNDSYSITVSEATPIGDVIINILATDMDPTDILQYSLIDGDNPGYFNITQNGEVFVVESLDFETVTRYDLIVAVTDRPYLTNASAVLALLTVVISDVNDNAPTFSLEQYMFTVLENSLPGLVGEVEAMDVDPANLTLRYTILSSLPVDGGFEIDSLSGNLFSTRPLDREKQDSYELRVQAVDSGQPQLSANTTVLIVVADENETPPTFTAATPSNVSVSESTAVGTVLLSLTAFDNDNMSVGFRIVGGDGVVSLAEGSGGLIEDSFPFYQTANLVLSRELDYENVTQHRLVIEVFDIPHPSEGMSLSSMTVITVIVNDANDNAPVFSESLYSAVIPELSPVGTSVLQLQATDADTGTNALFYYSIVDSSVLVDPFEVDSDAGIITVARPDDLTIGLIGSQYTLEVLVADLSDDTLSSTAVVVIELLDINDNAPFFPSSNITFTIEEDFTPVGTPYYDSSGDVLQFSGVGFVLRPISTVVAFDLDQGSNAELTFSLLTGSELFYINDTSGELFVRATLDREEQDVYTVEVQVTDGGTPSLQNITSVTVIVTDINDNAPMFLEDNYFGIVLENQPAGIDVVQVSAVDMDIGVNADVIFSILDSVPFQVDSESGIVRTIQPLDREEGDSHTFQVQARTGDLYSTATLTVRIEGENEFPPTISPDPLSTSITENTHNGTLVHTFTISDADSGTGEQSTVFLRPPTDLFSITDSGELRVAGHLDYELTPSVMSEVVVRNEDLPHFETIAQVFIDIVNENDNPPIVTFATSSVQYDELIQRRVSLDIGITIIDDDGRDVTRLVDGIVKFENEFLEPSFAYEPVTGGQSSPDFNCSLEVNKLLKFAPCGIPDVTVLSRYTEGVLLLHGGLEVGENVVGDSILFNATRQQYATYIGNVGTLEDNGLTISAWVWFQPTPSSSEPQAILSKISSSQLLYGVFCNSDGSLEFKFTSGGSPQSVVVPSGCTFLEGAWHHLGIVVNTRQGTLNVFIDGSELVSADIPQPFDSTGGFLLGASRASLNSLTTNFFNGRVHMLVVSLSSSDLNNLNCVTGCGLVLLSLDEDTLLTHYYDYSRRALVVDGVQPIEMYEDFLNSLALVLPFTEPRISQYMLSYTVQDEVFNCLPTFVDIIVVPSNDFQPELSLNGDSDSEYSTVFVEGSEPVPVVNMSSFYLIDMDLIEFEYVVVAHIINPLQPVTEELLTVRNVPDNMNVTYSSDYTLTLTGLFPLPVFEAVLATLSYENTADDPRTDALREILVTVSDPPLPNVSDLSYVRVIFINDHPSLAVVSTQREYREGDGAVPLLESASVTDLDNGNLFSASVVFTPLDRGMESLSANTANTDITATYDEINATLILSGVDIKDNYATVLLSITYEHRGMDNPTLGTRVFTLVISDGHASSFPRTVSLFFAGVNDAPVINLSGGAVFDFAVDFIEDTDEIVHITSPNATIVDVDGDTLVSVSIHLLNPEHDETIVVAIPDDSSIQATHMNDTFVILTPITGDGGPLSEFEPVLRNVQYRNVAEEPSPGIHAILFIASDGEDSGPAALSEVNVIPVNDRPELDLDTETLGTGYVADSFEEGGDPVFITGRSISLTDNDINDTVDIVMITIQDAADGLDEMIVSSDPTVVLPLPTNGQSVTYFISGDSLHNGDVIAFLTSLQYRNARLEPAPGERVISVSISDGIEFSNTGIVFLNVIGVNENAPQFTMSSYAFMITESQPAATSAGTVTASDIDDGRDGDVMYEIVSSEPVEGLNHFTINATEGLISTAVELDWELIMSYELIVSARDNGLPQRTTNTTVTVRVGDINDNPPVFYPEGDNIEIFVLETREVGFVVETVSLIDPDGGNDIISLVLINQFEVPFSVGVRDHVIIVNSDLDLDSQSPNGCESNVTFELQLEAEDFNPPFPTSTAVVTITVVDVNDNEPHFVSPASFSVTENSNTLYLFTVSATDLDCTSNGEITYSFPYNATYSLFTIEVGTGDVSSVVPLDREENDIHILTVLATDGGSPRHTATVDITLYVLDINDNPPVFNEEESEFIVSEDDVNVVLTGVRATDIDFGDNGKVSTYILDPNTVPVDSLNNEPFFTIDRSNGDIYFSSNNVSTDFEFQPSYTLTILAVDTGSLPLTGSATVLVNVTDVNDNAPEILNVVTRGEVPENEPAGFLVTTITASDVDSGQFGEVVFGLVGDENDFSIDPLTGDLTTARPFDFETECYFSLYVVASDRGPNPQSSVPHLFEVFVQPIDDNPPVFRSNLPIGGHYEVSIPENSPTGTSVIQVSAFDGDSTECYVPDAMIGEAEAGSGTGMGPESQITYSINQTFDIFTIDDATGVIRLLKPLDFEEVQAHVLTVVATDPGDFQTLATVFVHVLDRNDHTPQFLQPFYEGLVPENTPLGASVLQVTASDEDTLDLGRLTFSLSSVSRYFTVGSSDGVVSVSGVLDFESVSVVAVLVEVTDSAGNSERVNVTITIVDTNDLPPVINTPPREEVVFIEGQVSLRPFPRMNITDSDSFQHLCSASVSLYSPEQAAVDPLLLCTCTDTDSASTCTPGCVEFIQLSPDSFPGTIQQLQGGYELVLDGNYSIVEYEHALEDVVYVNVMFDPEPQSRAVSVSVFDCQLPSNTLVQSINIQPLNLVAPSLDLNGDAPGINYQTSFTERGDAVPIVSENVTISDADMTGMEQVLTGIDIRLTNQYDAQEAIYVTAPTTSISVIENSTYIMMFGVASLAEYATALKVVYYTNLAQEPSPGSRLIEFTAHQYSLSSPPAYTEITIATINDAPPTVIADPPNINTIRTYVEGSPGVNVVNTNAVITDDDSTNDNVTEMVVYVLNPEPTNDRLFVSNNISIPSSVMFEQTTPYSLSFTGSAPPSAYETVIRNIVYQYTGNEFESLLPNKVVFIQIADHSLSGFTVVQVELSPINDHPPMFAEDNITISIAENATVGSSVYQVDYTDGDKFSLTQLNFSIIGGDSFFEIAAETGVITLTESLDHETMPVHSFTVELTDEGLTSSQPFTTASLHITVLVTDQNDHVPMFTREVYNATVDEGAPIGTPVLQLTAEDRDSQMHSVLVFDVINTTAFRVDSSGTLFTAEILDQELVSSYQFIVSVGNPGDVATDTADIFISVLDVNDHPPSLTLSPDTATLREPQTLTELASTLTISDRDTSPSLDYGIVETLDDAPGVLLATHSLPGITVTGNGSDSLVFSGASQSLSDYEHVLRGVVYEDTAEEPLFVSRLIAYQVGSDPGLVLALNYTPSEQTSNITIFQVTVELINDHIPVIQLDTTNSMVSPACSVEDISYSTNFTEDSSPVVLSDRSLSITDSDSGDTMLYWATVELLQPLDGDLLHFSGSPVINVSKSIITRLVLRGPASIAEFETALGTVAYESLSQQPVGTRLVEFTVNDGQFTSDPILACVQLLEVNDAPVVTLGPNGTVDTILMYREGRSTGLVVAPQLEITGKPRAEWILSSKFDRRKSVQETF